MSQSAIAWIEDVDISLLEEIKRSVKYIKGNSKVAIPEKNVIVRKPEEDYKIEVYPCVSIYNINSIFNPADYNMYVRRDKVIEDGRMSYKNDNLPFYLKYQVDFWAKYQLDMNEMIKSWVAGHIRQFNLPIESDRGFSVNCVQEGNIVKQDILEGKDRLFHSLISYSIWVEIEDETLYNKRIVEGVTLDTHVIRR